MTLPRMAVKPHSTTQRWICHWALAAGVMVGVGREARALSRRAGHLAHIPRSKAPLPNPSGPPAQLAGVRWRANQWFENAPPHPPAFAGKGARSSRQEPPPTGTGGTEERRVGEEGFG